MGFDKNRFPNEDVDEELICSICSSVLEDPLQVKLIKLNFLNKDCFVVVIRRLFVNMHSVQSASRLVALINLVYFDFNPF